MNYFAIALEFTTPTYTLRLDKAAVFIMLCILPFAVLIEEYFVKPCISYTDTLNLDLEKLQ